jgi:hypothetical protein
VLAPQTKGNDDATDATDETDAIAAGEGSGALGGAENGRVGMTNGMRRMTNWIGPE